MKLSLSALAAITIVLPAQADIFWTGTVSSDIFDEANWDLTQSTVTVIDPDVTIMDNVVIRNAPADVEIPDLAGGGQVRFQVDELRTLTIDNSRVVAIGNDGVGCVPGTAIGMTVEVINGGSLEPFFVVNEVTVEIDSTSTVIFGGGGNPVNLSYVDMTDGATLAFLLEDPAEYTNEHLAKTTVDGLAGVLGGNLDVVSDGAMGSVVTVLPTVIGVPYCMANVNSTGASAEMEAAGSIDPVQNNLTLSCTALPQNSFAFFLTSQSQGFVANPGGSAGNLCVGGAIGRYVGPGQIQQSGSAGAVSLALNLTQMPSPTGFVAVMSGDTWNFQCWFRDTGAGGMAVSNFSNGLEVMFL